jgi:uncharacterized protein YhjY with autotransporter beta-barrel domain
VRAGATGFSAAGLDLAPDGQSAAGFTPLMEMVSSLFAPPRGSGAGDGQNSLLDDRLGVFVTGTLRRGEHSTTDAEAGFDTQSAGLTAGADYRLGSSYILGLAAGYGRSATGFDDDGGSLDAKSLSTQLYGSWYTGRYHLDWVLGYGHDADALTREISYTSSAVSLGCNGTTCLDQTSGATASHSFNGSVSAGGDFNSGAFTYGPTLEVEYKQVHVDGFDETGASGFDLNYGGLTSASLLGKVGGYASYALKAPWVVVVPQVRVRYLHEFQDGQRLQTVQFGADTLPDAQDRSFSIFTDVPTRNYYDWRASIVFQFRYGISGFVDYGGVAGLADMSMHQVDVGLRIGR